MSNADILGALDGPGAIYPPFERVTPYPKFLVVNIYAGYELTNGKSICISQADQLPLAQRLQTALSQIGFEWHISLQHPGQSCNNIGVRFEIAPLEYGTHAYELEIGIYYPWDKSTDDGIISLVGTDLSSLEKGVDTLIQVIQLAFKEFGIDIASLWIHDWFDTSPESA